MTKPPISDTAKLFGERLRARRVELGLSQERIAEHLGMHWSYVGKVERGQINLSLHNIVRIAAGLEIDPAELVHGLPFPPAEQLETKGRGRPVQ